MRSAGGREGQKGEVKKDVPLGVSLPRFRFDIPSQPRLCAKGPVAEWLKRNSQREDGRAGESERERERARR